MLWRRATIERGLRALEKASTGTHNIQKGGDSSGKHSGEGPVWPRRPDHLGSKAGDKHVITDNGTRVDTYNGSTHSWSTHNQQGQLTGGGVGETHPR
jgi:hypothetical protein